MGVERDEGFYAFMSQKLRHQDGSNCIDALDTLQPVGSAKIPHYGCATFTSGWATQRTMTSKPTQ